MSEHDDTGARAVHVPVLLERCLALLAPALGPDARPHGRDAVVVDCTLGLAGHAEALLTAHPALTLVGLDRDTEALAAATRRLAPFAPRVRLVHAVYDEIADVVAGLGFPTVDGVLFDLGVSSLQLDVADRGFSYAQDAPLDMRMDPTDGSPTAAELLNTLPGKELARILRVYGEERFASRVADAVVRSRGEAPFTTSARLVDVVRTAIPAATRRTGGNPAKRTFQALRIAVNRELEVLGRALPAALQVLGVGGRMVVLSYHSLEDRATKAALAPGLASTGPAGLPVELPGTEPRLRSLVRASEGPTEAEVAENPRAASVRLRAVERLRADPDHPFQARPTNRRDAA